MFFVDRLILVVAVLILLAVISSRLSSRVGLPFLVIFIGIGMLAGSEGIGRIPFEDYRLAHGIGTLALAVILFDGGLRTSGRIFRTIWGRGIVLATVGVLVTVAVVAVAASWLLGLTPLEGWLLGAIVGSTDAAAVFALFRSREVRVDEHLAATLEFESGSNDPMAIFLTVALLGLLTRGVDPGLGLLSSFVTQMLLGAGVGASVGFAGAWALQRIRLDAMGLYPVLAGACGLLAYGAAANVGGSGFLSVYVAGIVIGNSPIAVRRGLLLFHDGVAWLAQLVMFVMLGLLSFPSRLVDVAPQGLLIAGILMLVARPAAVAVCLLPFRVGWRELVFIAWAGLRGSVPIILAIYPLMFGYPNSLLLFDLVFFVVLVSAATQGWSLPPLARWLGLERPPLVTAPVSLEITSLQDVEGDIVEYVVVPESRARGRPVRELALPDGALVALIARGSEVIPPRGSTRIEAGDYVFVVMKPESRLLVDRVFAIGGDTPPPLPTGVVFPLRGRTTVGDLEEIYGVQMNAPPEATLDALLRERLGQPVPGNGVDIGGLWLVVAEMDRGRIERVDLVLPLEPPADRVG